MSLFGSKGRRHLDGHKDLTKHQEIISLVHGENTVKEVYFETYQDGILMGHTSEYVSVKVKSEIDRRNEIVSVMCTRLLDGEVWGNVIEG